MNLRKLGIQTAGDRWQFRTDIKGAWSYFPYTAEQAKYLEVNQAAYPDKEFLAYVFKNYQF